MHIGVLLQEPKNVKIIRPIVALRKHKTVEGHNMIEGTSIDIQEYIFIMTKEEGDHKYSDDHNTSI